MWNSLSKLFSKNSSLLKKIVFPMSILMVVAFLILGSRLISLVDHALEQSLEKRMSSFASFVQQSSSALIYNFDNQSLQRFVDEAKKDPDIAYLDFLDPNGKQLLEQDLSGSSKEKTNSIKAEVKSPKDGTTTIASITVAYSNAGTKAVVSSLTAAIALSLFAVLILQIVLVYVISRIISSRVMVTTHNLRNTANIAHKNSSEMQLTSNRLSEMSNTQASAIQETVATLNEITSMVHKTVDHAAASSEKSNLNFQISVEANQAVERMRKSMETIKGGIEEFGREVANSNQQISKIGGIIASIIEKTDVINDIVFQTKLLSFNASVEAARAGEHGKGFVVVAEEVGNLARMSGEASKEISQRLAHSQSDVNQIISQTKDIMERLISESNRTVADGVEIADHCNTVLQEAVRHADEVKRNMSEVAAAAKEQADGVQNITIAMNELDSTTHLQAEIAQAISSMASKIHKQGQEIQNAVFSMEIEINGQTGDAKKAQKASSIAKANLRSLSTETDDDDRELWEDEELPKAS